MAEAEAILFTVTREGGPSTGKEHAPKQFKLVPNSDSAILIGRAPVNDICIESRGMSQYHCEIRLNQSNGLCVRDLSMNGTGMKKPDGKYVASTITLRKDADEPLPDGGVIGIPMNLKENQTNKDRTWLLVKYNSAPAGSNGNSKATKLGIEETKEDEASEAGSEQEEDDAKERQDFVELLLETKSIVAGTTYEEADVMLRHDPAWPALRRATRRECFEIFVGHLGGAKKKGDKKKDKGGKKKKDKRDKEDVPPQKNNSDKKSDRKKRGRSRSGCGSDGDRNRSRRQRDAAHSLRGRRRGRSDAS